MGTRIRIGIVAGLALAAIPAWGASRSDETPRPRRVTTTHAAPRPVATFVKTAGAGSGVDFLLFDDVPAATTSSAPAAVGQASADRQDRTQARMVQARAAR